MRIEVSDILGRKLGCSLIIIAILSTSKLDDRLTMMSDQKRQMSNQKLICLDNLILILSTVHFIDKCVMQSLEDLHALIHQSLSPSKFLSVLNKSRNLMMFVLFF